jgi:hypothetical protein
MGTPFTPWYAHITDPASAVTIAACRTKYAVCVLQCGMCGAVWNVRCSDVAQVVFGFICGGLQLHQRTSQHACTRPIYNVEKAMIVFTKGTCVHQRHMCSPKPHVFTCVHQSHMCASVLRREHHASQRQQPTQPTPQPKPRPTPTHLPTPHPIQMLVHTHETRGI